MIETLQLMKTVFLQTATDPVHGACFYPDGANNSIMITYGARHIYFWKIFYDVARKKEAKILRDRNSGIFEVRRYLKSFIYIYRKVPINSEE